MARRQIGCWKAKLLPRPLPASMSDDRYRCHSSDRRLSSGVFRQQQRADAGSQSSSTTVGIFTWVLRSVSIASSDLRSDRGRNSSPHRQRWQRHQQQHPEVGNPSAQRSTSISSGCARRQRQRRRRQHLSNRSVTAQQVGDAAPITVIDTPSSSEKTDNWQIESPFVIGALARAGARRQQGGRRSTIIGCSSCARDLVHPQDKLKEMDDKTWGKLNRQACGTIRLCLAKD
ncbi:hypothetical protein ACLOJK_035347 [Asimina triloba]